ncbi:ABC transporter permease [Blastopirellula retiformator]|uniref:Putative aliphatic sulfonates transport permease protein SsuC n=1 Tax=Blastopirellula retiformator TaxID=2527970 RepID=A0A5C5V400_9BACT|nr:ABC transporter permease [Blastopirellula retiformator]TWT33061.1 putative aliphatic sulfonates transport permease protein SsuC [Blastopirellula retiformator]
MRETLQRILLPMVTLLIALAIWQGSVSLAKIPPYLLPSPAAVGSAFWNKGSALWFGSLLTGAGALAGFAAAVALGTLVALVFSQSRLIRLSGYPYAIFFQTVPIVAIAPWIVTLTGYGLPSVIVVATIISLFPIITSTTTGLLSVDRGLDELFRLHRASRWQTLWKLQFPAAIRYLVTGMKASSGLAVVGAIVGEFFVGYSGTQHGLGYYIRSSSDNLKTDELFAAMICCTLLGVIVFVSINLAERFFLRRWTQA